MRATNIINNVYAMLGIRLTVGVCALIMSK